MSLNTLVINSEDLCDWDTAFFFSSNFNFALNTILKLAYFKYHLGHYKECLKLLENISVNENEPLCCLITLCWIKLEQIDEAKKFLDSLKCDNNEKDVSIKSNTDESSQLIEEILLNPLEDFTTNHTTHYQRLAYWTFIVNQSLLKINKNPIETDLNTLKTLSGPLMTSVINSEPYVLVVLVCKISFSNYQEQLMWMGISLDNISGYFTSFFTKGKRLPDLFHPFINSPSSVPLIEFYMLRNLSPVLAFDRVLRLEKIKPISIPTVYAILQLGFTAPSPVREAYSSLLSHFVQTSCDLPLVSALTHSIAALGSYTSLKVEEANLGLFDWPTLYFLWKFKAQMYRESHRLIQARQASEAACALSLNSPDAQELIETINSYGGDFSLGVMNE